MIYTEIDNMAWDLFPKTGLTQNKDFFVYWKSHWPYSFYYEQAEILFRKEKINRIKNNLQWKKEF